MCGIAGIYSQKHPLERSWITSMTNAMKHRGPDDEGYLAVETHARRATPLIGADSKVSGSSIDQYQKNAGLFLGHRRLSIIDLSPAGHQPMPNSDQTLWLIYNGEIYNYLALKEELKRLGYVFKTNTDTEVILAAYEHWGKDCVKRFNGMWAFVIYDQRKNILFGSRDRFGVKPFYYFLDDDHFAFASEIKALIKMPFIKKEINQTAVYDFLTYELEEHHEETFFKSIFELFPGYSFEFNINENLLTKWPYYTLSYENKWEKFDEKKLQGHVARVKELITEAVQLRLQSDVPVGTSLSGGIDSSGIVCLINDILKKEKVACVGERQKTFTACYKDDASIDESRWADLIIEKTKASGYKTFPDANGLLKDLEELVYAQDIPFSSSRTYAQFQVMRLASQNGIKVLLDGQGADELFAGYFPAHGFFFKEIFQNRDFSRLGLEWRNRDNSQINTKLLLSSFLKVCCAQGPAKPAFHFLKQKFSKSGPSLNEKFRAAYRHRREKSVWEAGENLNQALHYYMGPHYLKNLLRCEDRNSMHFSIEARTPFADDVNLIDYVFSVPSSYKIYQGSSKYLLRMAMAGVLPEEIRTRPDKLGFATPEHLWLKNLKENLKTYISKDLEPFIETGKVFNAWDKPLGHSQYALTDTNMWRVINFAVWKKVFKV